MNMERKVCKKCNVEKPLDEFYYRKNENRFETMCKECTIEQRKKYYKEKREDVLEYAKKYRKDNCEKIIGYLEKYREENRENALEYARNYRKDNPDKIKESKKKYKLQNPDKIKESKKKSNQKPKTKILVNARRRIKVYLNKYGLVKKNKTFEIVGCTPDFLKEHLEKQFKDNMSWDNYGLFGWHIDHIIPLSSAKTEEEIYKLCHYTNLQPLWAEENLKKSNKLIKKEIA